MTIATTNEPRCWIGSLAAYNGSHDGVPRLIGDWYPATEAADVTVADLHAGTNVPFTDDDELYVLDLDGDWPVRREMDPAEAARWGEIYEEVGDAQWPALCAWVRSGSYVAEGDTDYPVISDFEDRYCGSGWDSFQDYAEGLAEDIGLLSEVPESLQSYFDMQSWARDLAFDYVTERDTDGTLHIFRSY